MFDDLKVSSKGLKAKRTNETPLINGTQLSVKVPLEILLNKSKMGGSQFLFTLGLRYGNS